MKHSRLSKILSLLLVGIMLLGVIPVTAFAASIYDDSNGGSDYYNVISEKEWDIAPGVKEYEQVLNNDAGTRRQVLHTAVVDVNNPYVKVIPGTKGMWPQPGNYGTQSTSTQALEAEKLGYGNVVVATNCSLSWYTEAYYKEHPELIGEPLGYSILDGQIYTNSRMEYNETTKTFNNGGGVKTVIVINYDNHPITGEERPDDMPKVWIRNVTDPLTGWEQQAIPLLFELLVQPGADGKPEITKYGNTGAHGTGIASRTFVGVRPDGSLVIAVSDGEQAPYSTGFTQFEMAEYMIKMGCIIAANCDGGGSTTFCSQRPGEDLKVNCSLSDGGERPTSNTILVVSTAPANGEFARAQITTDYDYYTPGSTVNFNALGFDAVGTKAEIPSNVEWKIVESGMGTIENGVFKSNGTEGTVTVQMILDGNVVGEKKITVVTPDKIFFSQPVVTIPFGKTAKFPVKASAMINDVAQEIGLSASDVTFTTTNEALGKFDGLFFTAVSEADAPEATTATVTATLNIGNHSSVSVTMKLGEASEVLWDFEGGQSDVDIWNVINSRTNDYRDYYLKLSLADRTNGQVHDGDYSMRLEINGLSSKKSDSSDYAWIRLGVDGDAIELENARRVGFWLYVPEDNIQCWVQGHYMTDSNGDGVYDTLATVSMMESENVYYNIDESGWYYMSMDISAFEKVALKYSNQFNKQDANGQTTGQLTEKGEFFIAIITHRTKNNLLWQTNGTINGPYTYYLDGFTVDYSDAVDDRENPVFDKIYLDGKTPLIKRDVVTTKNNVLNLSVAVSDKLTLADAMGVEQPLYNVSGLNAATAKAYIDGVAVDCTFENDVISVKDHKVADGYHRVKFEICDNAGNKSVIIRVIKVESGKKSSTISLVPADPSLDRIYFGSVYWMNLEATNIETVQSVQTVIDLNSVNHWQLEHMVLTEGFTADYTVNEETNTATITITRTGSNAQTGKAVLASLPVRILYFDTDIKVPGFNAQTYWTTYNFFAQDMKMDVDMGLITHVDGTKTTFSNEEFHVDTEMYTTNQAIDKTYFIEHGTTHVHTPVAIGEIAPTCTAPGYKGGTFCYECNSPVEWGEVTGVATGHTYEVDTYERNIVCDCGETITGTGLYNIGGKNYYAVKGKVTGGWQMINNDWYLFSNTTFEGLNGRQTTDTGVKYVFDNGRVTDGVWVTTSKGTRYWYGPSFYVDTSYDFNTGMPYVIEGKTYLFDRYGYMQTGVVKSGTGDYDGFSVTYVYYDCGDDGVASLLQGPGYEGYFYIDGARQSAYQVIEFEGAYYYVGDYNKYLVNQRVFIESNLLEGTSLKQGWYSFGADGKMIIKNGPDADGFFYLNGVKQTAYQVIEYEGAYYYVGDYNKYLVNQRVFIESKLLEGTTLKQGWYSFGADGKMIIKNGPDTDGFFYLNGVKQTAYQVIEYEGAYYYVGDYNKYLVNQRVFIESNLLEETNLKQGWYSFGADGKMIMKNGPDADGFFYLNGGKQSAYQVIEYEGAYYYIGDYNKYLVNQRVFIESNLLEGTNLKQGWYSFGADGKMIVEE